MKTTVITYGTFDLFHIGHLNLLRRLKALGDELIVGVSTDQFNEEKGKKTIIRFEDRAEIVSSLKYVDKVIAESSWNQKAKDIKKYNVSIFGMGHDWQSHFDHLKCYCSVIYLPRTDGISSSELKSTLKIFDPTQMSEIKKALDTLNSIVEKISYIK
ncbi:MAG: adenylyltransferase/cytidyltransferase family protein [Thermosphaera sp.]